MLVISPILPFCCRCSDCCYHRARLVPHVVCASDSFWASTPILHAGGWPPVGATCYVISAFLLVLFHFVLIVDFRGFSPTSLGGTGGLLTSTLLFQYFETPLVTAYCSIYWTPRLHSSVVEAPTLHCVLPCDGMHAGQRKNKLIQYNILVPGTL